MAEQTPTTTQYPVDTWVLKKKKTLLDVGIDVVRPFRDGAEIWCLSMNEVFVLDSCNLKLQHIVTADLYGEGPTPDNWPSVNDIATYIDDDDQDVVIAATDVGLRYKVMELFIESDLLIFGHAKDRYTAVVVHDDYIFAYNASRRKIEKYVPNPNPRALFGRPPSFWKKIQTLSLAARFGELNAMAMMEEGESIKCCFNSSGKVAYLTLDLHLLSHKSLAVKKPKFASLDSGSRYGIEDVILYDDVTNKLLLDNGSGDVREIRLQPAPENPPLYAYMLDDRLYVTYEGSHPGDALESVADVEMYEKPEGSCCASD